MSASAGFRKKHFSLRDLAVSYLSEKLFDHLTYTVRSGLIKGMKRKGGLGFLPAFVSRSSGFETEQRFLQTLDLKGKVVYDIGAFQGIMTLFFARQAQQVVTYEPLPLNYQRLLENVEINALPNVIALNRAVGDREGKLTLTFDPLLQGAASGSPGIQAQIAQSLRSAESVEVSMVRLDEDIARDHLPSPDFIKFDIEGMEYCALVGAKSTLRRSQPALYIEMHGADDDEKESNARRVVQFLAEISYTYFFHVETGIEFNPGSASVARQGHVFCRSNP